MGFMTTPISLFPVKPVRKIGDIAVNVVINESTSDRLTITKQPVQQGANIADHAFMEPTVFSCSILMKDNVLKSLSKVYKDFLDLQSSRVPFSIVTPKRIYSNMLITSLGQTTEKSTENCLAILLSCEEVIIVQVTTTQVPRVKQRNAAATGKTENVGKKSALQTFKEGITGAFGG
jgi:hypothetical protein